MADNYFQQLYAIDFGDQVKQKNGLNYISWAASWAAVKKLYPEATFKIYERETPDGLIVNYFTDGKTCWVKTGVTINGIEHIEELPIMDFKNKSIPLDNVESTNVNKAIQRSLTKACARHGVGLFVFQGEDLPEETKELDTLRAEAWHQFCLKAKISADAKTKANVLCKGADESGDPREINDTEKLKELIKKLKAIRK